MSRLILVILVFAVLLPTASGQVVKLQLSAGSGLSWFGGNGAVNASDFYASDSPSLPSYMLEPYGNRHFTNYYAGLKAETGLTIFRISLATNYEYTGGRLGINRYISRGIQRDTNGYYEKNFHFLSINPSIGYRLGTKNLSVQGMLGLDYALGLTRGERFNFTNEQGLVSSYGGSGDKNDIQDVRLSAAVMLNLSRWSLDVKYKHGLVDYWKNNPSGAYLRQFNAGISYRLFQFL